MQDRISMSVSRSVLLAFVSSKVSIQRQWGKIEIKSDYKIKLYSPEQKWIAMKLLCEFGSGFK